jgi:uncharacterized phage protein (TIGR01671 family)
MNRIIKFRGRRTDNGAWAYGDLKHTCAVADDGFLTKICMVGGYEVDHHTIGQLTGAYDRDGKEVYEGDVIAITYREKDTGELLCIEYAPVMFCTTTSAWWCGCEVGEFFLFRGNPKNIAVVGDVFRNFDLLTNEDKEEWSELYSEGYRWPHEN